MNTARIKRIAKALRREGWENATLNLSAKERTDANELLRVKVEAFIAMVRDELKGKTDVPESRIDELIKRELGISARKDVADRRVSGGTESRSR